MAKEHIIPITNGRGSKELVDGNYSVTVTASGYDLSSLSPSTQEITEGVDSYQFTIAATGTLTLHVTDDGTDIGIPIAGAEFYRCDADGTNYGDVITSDDEGNAIFNNVPYADDETAPNVYYKQVSSDGEHGFDNTLQSVTLEAETKTVEVENPIAVSREFQLTDANYLNLPIENASLNLSGE